MIDTTKSENSSFVKGASIRPFAGPQPNPIMEPQSPHSGWQFTTNLVKQEPLSEKNDSGINSGSNSHSSSPGSETIQDLPMPLSAPNINNISPQPPNIYSTPMLSRTLLPNLFQFNMPHIQYNHNPLTPPNSEPQISPKSDNHNFHNDKPSVNGKISSNNTTLTPCASPNNAIIMKNEQDPLRNLQMSLEKSGLFPTTLSTVSKSSESDDKSDNDLDELDEQSLRVPRINSHGKVKTFKCKQCEYVALTKLEFWEHSKSHIKEDKRLTCPKCPFVTEYKHHLEYHLRNHSGSKPFKCSQCNYSCVNKSMLNSHMKSHSNIYQYRCADCTYATKYCHSLKLHLRKYLHNPDMVLNPDGTPNPLPIIDVYGTRRGPKVKSHQSDSDTKESSSNNSPSPNPIQQLQFPYPPLLNGFPVSFPNPQLLQNFHQMLKEKQAAALSQQFDSSNLSSSDDMEQKPEVLDLSKPCMTQENTYTKSRRKGPAFKLEHLAANCSDNDDEDDDDDYSDITTTIFSNVEVVENKNEESNISMGEDDKCLVNNNINNNINNNNNNNNNNNKINNTINKEYNNICHCCDIAFGDPVLYTMHMGYHGYQNPFTCNMCGTVCTDKIAFFLHIARTPHS